MYTTQNIEKLRAQLARFEDENSHNVNGSIQNDSELPSDNVSLKNCNSDPEGDRDECTDSQTKVVETGDKPATTSSSESKVREENNDKELNTDSKSLLNGQIPASSDTLSPNVIDGNKVLDRDTIDGDTVDGGTVNGGTVDGDTVDGDTVDGGTVDGDTVDGDTVGGGTVGGGTVGGGTVDGGTVGGGTVGWRYSGWRYSGWRYSGWRYSGWR